MSRAAKRPTSNSAGSATKRPRTVQEALDDGRAALRARSRDDAQREALYLLAGVLGLTPPRIVLGETAWKDVAEWLLQSARRATRTPLLMSRLESR